MRVAEAEVKQLAESAIAQDARAGARLITLIESGASDLYPALSTLYSAGGHARIVGVTGPPGAGKSTLVDQLIAYYRAANLRVAVLAVDPSSPKSGGAVLGDRFRMSQHYSDAGVFIRSMANRGALGGLARSTPDALVVLDAMGWDIVLLETVGVGQSEIDIMRHAGAVLVLQTSHSGDALQSVKAGLLEIADIFVVNRASEPDAQRTVRALREMVHVDAERRGEAAWPVSVCETEALTGEGIAALAASIERRFTYLTDNPKARAQLRHMQVRVHMEAIAAGIVAARLTDRGGAGAPGSDVVADVVARRRDLYATARALVGGDD